LRRDGGEWIRNIPHCCWSAKNSNISTKRSPREKTRSAVVQGGVIGNEETRRSRYAGVATRKRSTFWNHEMKTMFNTMKPRRLIFDLTISLGTS
jgi:hypothetical protein